MHKQFIFLILPILSLHAMQSARWQRGEDFGCGFIGGFASGLVLGKYNVPAAAVGMHASVAWQYIRQGDTTIAGYVGRGSCELPGYVVGGMCGMRSRRLAQTVACWMRRQAHEIRVLCCPPEYEHES